MTERVNRRTFLLGALAAPVLSASVARAAAPEKLKLGIIGCGGQGRYNWSNVADEEVVMLCDVDLERAAPAAQRFPKAEVTQDFRRVLDRKDIDAVVVSTPDHWHAIPSVWAMQAEKHVYCEKPLGHSVYECRAMAEAAKRHRRVTQMGTQIHAGSNYRRVVELVRAGAVGPISRIDVWCERRPDSARRATQAAPVPASLDYEMWVGPAPMRPYDPAVLPFKWRWWWEFGGGVLADMGCHFMDLPHWALDLRHVERVVAQANEDPASDNRMPVEMRVDYYYPARDGRGPIQLTWWHGNPGPKDADGKVINVAGFRNGVLFHGTEGQLVADYGAHKLLPEEKFADYRRPAPSIPESIGHHKEWIQAIKSGGGPTTCNFDYSGALAETVLLGNVAYRLGQEVRWDSKELRVTNASPSAWEPLVRRQYRSPWKLRR